MYYIKKKIVFNFKLGLQEKSSLLVFITLVFEFFMTLQNDLSILRLQIMNAMISQLQFISFSRAVLTSNS
jgi:hypothetical protein